MTHHSLLITSVALASAPRSSTWLYSPMIRSARSRSVLYRWTALASAGVQR